jgi:regulator of nucleoside diphosphate kinase
MPAPARGAPFRRVRGSHARVAPAIPQPLLKREERMTSDIDDESEAHTGCNVHAMAGLPPVLVTSGDARRLRAMLSGTPAGTDASVIRFLTRELDRAVVCQPDIVPSDVVTMNSRVFFRRNVGQPIESRTLVYDEDYAVPGATLSVFTPLGAALLGLRDGSRMPYVSREGIRYVAVVERVAYQPEGEGRLQRAPYRYWPQSAERDGAPAGTGRVVALRPRPQQHPHAPAPADDDSGPNDAA